VTDPRPPAGAASPKPARATAEFTTELPRDFDHSTPFRWLLSHLAETKGLFVVFIVGSLIAAALNGFVPIYTGRAFDEVLGDTDDPLGVLLRIALILLIVVVLRGAFDIVARLAIETISKRIGRNTREELFVSLLGKSQTFHNRQQVGDLMARATNDVRQISLGFSPGVDLIFDSMTALVTPFFFIAFLEPRLLLSPVLFLIGFILAVWYYMRKLTPVSDKMRAQFGVMNAGLNEAVRGIEVIKATGQEAQERRRFRNQARLYRDYQVAQGVVQARYLPTLLLAISIAGALLHGAWMVNHDQLTLGELIAYLGLMQQLGFPAFISIFSFAMVQMGLSASARVLGLIKEETELDQNAAGYSGEMRGELAFDDVTFSYEEDEGPVIDDMTFSVAAGETIAIVGETGSGKSSLTKLVNRIFDVDSGRVLVDGVDVRDWNLDALRSNISTIEQDVTLFSRSIAENIGFGMGDRISREAIVQAAKDAQAHEFILELENGYDTVIGERGVTLSGGQRQRLAIARALITEPKILILDDSTSAIDSATEDRIQTAIRRVLEGRTTLLITHRLSQIRHADRVLLIRKGRLAALGSHEELLATSPLYRRIFSHYDEIQPPAGAVAAGAGEGE
jgi:ATP-binding cassette subfamily B protein